MVSQKLLGVAAERPAPRIRLPTFRYHSAKGLLSAHHAKQEFLRQQRRGLLEKFHCAARGVTSAAAQPVAQQKMRFRQCGDQRMMGGPAMLARVRSAQGALLVTVSLKYLKQKHAEGFHRIDGVRRGQRKRQMLPHCVATTEAPQKFQKYHQPAKRSHRPPQSEVIFQCTVSSSPVFLLAN